jgi:hypothetical protein
MHQPKMFQIFRSAVTAKNGIFNAMPCHVCTKEIVGDVGNTRNVKGGN